ncbi:MAG TPA: MarR family transcriptional regulator [Syntrophorhabdaceae bacterium]|nr:MarR family transcriptional regulator [Syntrophorhabdaceae bacterium]
MRLRRASEKLAGDCVTELSSCHFTRLMMLSDVINRYVNIALKDEVNWLKMGVLINLALSDKGIAPSELARNLLRPKQNATTILNNLEKEGLVARNRGKRDRRVVQVFITTDGLKYILESLRKIAPVERELTYCLNEPELTAISVMVKKIRRHMVSLVMGNPDHIKNQIKGVRRPLRHQPVRKRGVSR